jgi:tetratricopeptide (TPR) repeat protein
MIEESVAQFMTQGKPAEALALVASAIARGETAELWNDWASIQYGCSKLAEAERGYRRALQLDSRHRQAAVNLGLLLLTQGRLQEATPFFEQHRNTLTAEEQQAIHNLAAGLHPENHTRSPKLSLVMPTNRTGLATCARILDACSCADENVEVIIRDNSGDAAKRDILSRISVENCRVLLVDPCDAVENSRKATALSQGEFVFCIADDDVLHRASINPTLELIGRCAADKSVIGITGTYLIDGYGGTRVFRYPQLDSKSAQYRVGNYLKDIGSNAINYSVLRRSVLNTVLSFCSKVPLWFSFSDQILALMYLACGRFGRIEQILYQYNCLNWDSPERALQSDLRYLRHCGLDGATVRFMWLICGFEGAKIVQGKLNILELSRNERENLATLWMQNMYSRFLVTMSHRTDPTSHLDREALSLCNKWKGTSPPLNFEPLLADISEFFSLTDRAIGEKYYEFWKDQAESRSNQEAHR